MDKELREYLREDEQVRWQGQPDLFPLLEGSVKKQILRTWIVTGVVVCGLLVWYFNFYEDKSAGFLGLMLIIAALIVISPVMERRNLLGQSYWITNQRVILRTRDNSYYYMNLDGIDEIRVIRDKSDNGCLALGKIVFEDVDKQLRWRACHPKEDMQGHEDQACVLGMILYDLKDVDRAAELLKKRPSSAVA